MPIQSAIPYLFFSGTAETALSHYERALGGKTEGLVRFGEMQGVPADEQTKSRVANAMMKLGAASIMVSDTEAGQEASRVSNVEICLTYDDLPEMKRHFAALGEGGSVTAPIHLAPWGDMFGALTDKFGIRWMFTGPGKQG